MKRRRYRTMVWAAAVVPLSLLLGLATTVAVAARGARAYERRVLLGVAGAVPLVEDWSWSELPGVSVARGTGGPAVDVARLSADESLSVEYESLTGTQWRRFILSRSYHPETPTHDRGSSSGRITIYVEMYRYGWPLRSFYTVRKLRDGWRRGGSRGPEMVTESGELPFAPGEVIWWPLLANSVALAVPWAMLFATVPLAGVVKRRNRRRRRCCEACNYNRKGIAADAVCPDCGKRP